MKTSKKVLKKTTPIEKIYQSKISSGETSKNLCSVSKLKEKRSIFHAIPATYQIAIIFSRNDSHCDNFKKLKYSINIANLSKNPVF